MQIFKSVRRRCTSNHFFPLLQLPVITEFAIFTTRPHDEQQRVGVPVEHPSEHVSNSDGRSVCGARAQREDEQIRGSSCKNQAALIIVVEQRIHNKIFYSQIFDRNDLR